MFISLKINWLGVTKVECLIIITIWSSVIMIELFYYYIQYFSVSDFILFYYLFCKFRA